MRKGHALVVLVSLWALNAFSSALAAAAVAPGGRSPAGALLDGDDIQTLAQHVAVHPSVLLAASRLAGRQPRDVVQVLQSDAASAKLTRSGAIVYGCSLHPRHDAGGPAERPPPRQQPCWDPGQAIGGAVADEPDLGSRVFQLHSRPSSPRKIFLEFQGCVTENTTGWNEWYNVSRIVTPPYDADGDPTQLSQRERRHIRTIHAGVAEAFSAWDVDVTTEDPGEDGLTRRNVTDDEYGIRVCVGGHSNWTGTHIGGVATLNSFGWVNGGEPGQAVYRDAFAFSAELVDRDGNIHLAYIYKTIVHELGHTLGLAHKGFRFKDNNTTQEYFTVPPANSTWVPVMGVPGKGIFAQFSRGEYPDGHVSSNFDDELAIINNTLPLLPKAGGGSAADAAVLCLHTSCSSRSSSSSSSNSGSGSEGAGGGRLRSAVVSRIRQPGERDCFNLTVTPAIAPITARLSVHENYQQESGPNASRRQPWRVSNLRLQLVALHPPGAEVVARQPVDELAWWQEYQVATPSPGVVTLCVEPTTQLSSTRRELVLPSNYGNIGRYVLEVRARRHGA